MLLVKTKLGQSKINGIGLFADEFIAKGTKVIERSFLDVTIIKDKLNHLSNYCRNQILNYGCCRADLVYLECDDARFVNHSDTPNMDGSEAYYDIALKDINPGEELTEDYRVIDDGTGCSAFLDEIVLTKEQLITCQSRGIMKDVKIVNGVARLPRKLAKLK